MKLATVICLFAIMILVPRWLYSECNNYKLIDHGDRVEVVCVGDPTHEDNAIKDQVKQKNNKQDDDPSQQKTQTQQKEVAITTSADSANDDKIDIISHDIIYKRGGSKRPERLSGNGGEYSIKVVAKNNGSKGLVRFRLKKIDFSGFEIISFTFDEIFEKDESKTVTNVQPGKEVTIFSASDWIVDAYKIDGVLIK